MEFAAFRRKLPGVQVVLAHVFGPIGGEGAMGGARHRVLEDGRLGGEKPRNKVARNSRCRHDDAAGPEVDLSNTGRSMAMLVTSSWLS